MKKTVIVFIFSALNIIAAAQTKSIIHFDSNKDELKTPAIHILDSIKDFLSTSKDYQISIHAYCDNSGDEGKNMTLSEKRADAVSDYFKNKNIPLQFISTKGFSDSDPVADNTNEKGKAENRRAEIIISMKTPIPLNTNPPSTTPVPLAPQVKNPAPALEKKEAFSSTSSIDDLEVGQTLILKNLNFVAGTATLLDEARPTLEFLVKTLKETPSLEIEIGGHVCCANDMELSILRARSVYKYLIKKGINESRLTYKGYSRSRPIYEDDKREFEAKANRRVEITVLKK